MDVFNLIFLFIEFFDELHYGIDGAVLPALRADLALSYAQIGLLLGLPNILGSLIEPVIFLLGDTDLRKRLVIGGGLATVTALLLIAGSGSFPAVLIGFLINYPASGAFVSLSQASLMDRNAGREAQMMARWTFAGSLGNLLGPLLVAGGFALALGWRWVFFVLVLVALPLVLAAWLHHFPSHFARQEEACTGDISLLEIWKNLRKTATNLYLLRWIGLLHLSDLLLDVFTGYVALYFTDIVGATPAQAGLILGGMMLSGVLADLLLIPLLERLPGRRLVRLSALAALFIYPAWLLAPWPFAKVILLIAVRFSTLGWYPVLQGEMYASVSGLSATALAVDSFTGILGGGIIWLVGWVASQAGLRSAMWLLLVGPLSLALFLPKEQQNS